MSSEPTNTEDSSTARVGTSTSSTARAGNTEAQPRLERSSLWAAIVSGIIGFLCFVAVPFLPVNQTQSSVSWPQHDSLNSIQTPLISYAPVDFTAEIPLSAVDKLNKDQTLVVGTLAEDFIHAAKRGFFVRVDPTGGVDISSRGKVLFTVDQDTLRRLPADAHVSVKLTEKLSTLEIPGAKDAAGQPLSVTLDDEDHRPDVMGVYSELADTPENVKALQKAGLIIQYTIDSRFSTSPTILKSGATVLGLICLVVAFICLHRFDTLDRSRPRGLLPTGWWKFTGLDWVVTAILVFWHIFGANTSDDGYILTMAREAQASGYMANYFRWYGVPESPFGFPYYDLQSLMAQVSTASMWMRLPALFSAFGIWLILSRSLLPRLGSAIANSRSAHWTAAFVFLSIWLPFNNGTRPEPVVALGVMLAWACFERAISARRLLPAAIGLVIATLTLGAGPTGLIAVATFLVSLLPLFKVVKQRIGLFQEAVGTPTISPLLAISAMLAPFLPAGTAILAGAFGDQTLASVLESVRVRSTIGPSYRWFEEFARYYGLTELDTVDGSFPRRVGVLIFFASSALLLVALLRFRRIQGISHDVTVRMLSIIMLSTAFLMFTPTKWTHHFGAFAGIAGAVGAMAAVVLGIITARSVFNKYMSTAAVLFIFAYCLSGSNGWWYVSSWKVPWWDKSIQYNAHLLSNGVLYFALAVFLVGVIRNMVKQIQISEPSPEEPPATSEARTAVSKKLVAVVSSPILVVSAVTVLVDAASISKAFASQYPAYTVGLGNLRTFTGDTCQLSQEVMVEKDTNNAFLKPVGTSLAESLTVNNPKGFTPNGVPSTAAVSGLSDVESSAAAPEATDSTAGTASGASVAGAATHGSTTAGATLTTSTGQTTPGHSVANTSSNVTTPVKGAALREEEGANGSQVALPFGVDYKKVPVMGSWSDGTQLPASLTSAWFELPQRREDQPLLVVSAAGKVLHHNMDGIKVDGEKLVVEYATLHDDGSVTDTGQLELLDVGKSPQWRNLRVKMEDIPESANVVRLQLEDNNLDKSRWLAVLPPRVPTLEPLTTFFDTDEPVLLDWSVGLQFPCQRPFEHYAGVTEVPRYRITPDVAGKDVLSGFQSEEGGGVMGVVDAVNSMDHLPAYLNKDWQRDWGTLEIYKQRTNSLDIAPDPGDVDYQEITRSGLWSTGHMKITEPD